MKKFTFITGGSWGKLESWDGIIDFELTDEEAVRLMAAAKGKDVWDFRDDPEVKDIYARVYEAEYENEIKGIMSEKNQMADLISDYLDEEENFEAPTYCKEIGAWIKKAIPFSERELAEEYFGNSTLSIGYPEELTIEEDEDE